MLVKPDSRVGAARHFGVGTTFRPILELRPFQYSDLPPRLYEMSEVRPRAYVTHSVRAVENEEQLIRLFGSSEEIGFDNSPYHSYVLERDRDIIQEWRAEETEGLDRVELLSDDVEVIRFRVVMAAAGLFVLADQYYPGWEARVDGRRAGILQVNLVNRGVALGAGEHLVEMVYRPQSLYWGLAIAAVGLCLLAGIVSRVLYGSR